MSQNSKIGVLLVNLGTPDSPSVRDVRRYLRQFLSDPLVIDLPQPFRWLLLNLFILPTRPRTSAAAYQSIWMEEGSPLLHFGRELTHAVATRLGDEYHVELAMRYGSPSIESGLTNLLELNPSKIVVLPLFPQYATASTGSALAEISRVLKGVATPPPVHTIGAFFDDPRFCDAMATSAREVIDREKPDHVVLSFHGLPEKQVRDLDTSGAHCLVKSDCCDAPCAENENCYRAHCFATARSLRSALGLREEETSLVFQSRLNRTGWLDPDLVKVLPKLAARGIKRPVVLCPAFVADCLETVEEIGIRARTQWREPGGDELFLVPCVNADPAWADGVASMVRDVAGSMSAEHGQA